MKLHCSKINVTSSFYFLKKLRKLATYLVNAFTLHSSSKVRLLVRIFTTQWLINSVSSNVVWDRFRKCSFTTSNLCKLLLTTKCYNFFVKYKRFHFRNELLHVLCSNIFFTTKMNSLSCHRFGRLSIAFAVKLRNGHLQVSLSCSQI